MRTDRIIKVYNSSNCLIWEGNEQEFEELKEEGYLETTDKVVEEEL